MKLQISLCMPDAVAESPKMRMPEPGEGRKPARPTPEMPKAGEGRKAEYKPSIEDTVRRYIELVDSGHESSVEWIALNKLYAALCKKPKTPRIENLLKMIKPILNKFGYHGVVAESK